MSTTSTPTPNELGVAFLSQLRSEHAAAVARAEQASIEAERLAKEAEKLAGALEAAERFVAEYFDAAVPRLTTDEKGTSLTQSSEETPTLDLTTPYALAHSRRMVDLGRDEGWAKLLRGMTQKQALIAIAEHEGGTLDVSKARNIFLEFGLTASKDPRTVYGVIHTLLRGSERFNKIGSGQFRLINSNQATAGQLVSDQCELRID
jgi:hypothetical protein